MLLFSAFAASLTYLYGVNDFSSSTNKSAVRPGLQNKPVYANKAELEKVFYKCYFTDRNSPTELNYQAIEEIHKLVGEDAITTDDDELKRHGYSEWSSINIEQLPIAIAYPKSTQEVSEIAKVCSKYKIPIGEYIYQPHSLESDISDYNSPIFWRFLSRR